MNVLLISEENDAISERVVNNVENCYDNIEESFNNKIKFLKSKNGKTKVDVYLIISDKTEFIEMEFNKIKEKNKVMIVTQNFTPKHVIACLILTENLYSGKKEEKYILEKITNLLQKNRVLPVNLRRLCRLPAATGTDILSQMMPL